MCLSLLRHHYNPPALLIFYFIIIYVCFILFYYLIYSYIHLFILYQARAYIKNDDVVVMNKITINSH